MATETSNAAGDLYPSAESWCEDIDGRQPIELTSDRLKRMSPLPVVWKDQEQLLQIT